MWGNSRLHYCLKLGPREAAWAESSRNWLGQRRDRCRLTQLPPGLIQPSPVEPNITDPAALATRLRALIKPEARGRSPVHRVMAQVPRPVALIVPDLCVRAVIFRLDNVPTRSAEREALIRWRLGQEQLFPLVGAKVVSQPLSTNGNRATGPQTVLAVAIQDTVLHQYEAACEAVGLAPMQVDAASFRLFNLWARATQGTGGNGAEDLLWLSLLDGGLTLLVFHAGQLVFLRSKLQLSGGRVADESSRLEAEQADKVVAEIAASLLSCAETYPDLAAKHLILVSEGPQPGFARQLSEEFGVGVEELGVAQAESAGWNPANASVPRGVLPAIAGLLGER
ncbi:MAG: type IV pilus biogenesis protein PilM [Nitrospiraceae bacterium]